MRFYIKTLTKKFIFGTNNLTFLYKDLTNNTFPKKPCSKVNINARLSAAYYDIKRGDYKHNIGALGAIADIYATKVFQKFIHVNPNNIGNWSNNPTEIGTKRLEYEVIQKLISLYHGQREHLDGYVTSGGTEGNLFGVWVGKLFLLKYHSLDQICLMKTCLTHYSIDKACNMCSVNQVDVALNPNTWTMDPGALEMAIENKIKNGVSGFIICLTLGYTETGSCDDIQKISKTLESIKKKYKKIEFSVTIDAAISGLTIPFIKSDFHPFLSKYIHVLSIDFSKFTAVPYPAGAVLYRGYLKRLVERKVPVFSMSDSTVLGSRPGAPVAAIWATIHKNGISGYKTIVERQLKIKEYFIKNLNELYPDAEIINNKYSISCGLIVNKYKNQTLPNEINDLCWVHAKRASIVFSDGKTRKITMYKFFFLTHITKQAIKKIIEVIKSANSS